ncbi:MAG: histidinol-phosphate transaminase [Nitrosopumilus sp.]|nr:histidinol-phosphate transaminase [Nitrosopumilus sp.]NNL59340.1 histidinol-phosphate transaminase [Nitrosopumilus sp.]
MPVKHGAKNPFDHSKTIIDFSSNITPIGMPKSVRQVIQKNLENIENYPDSDSSLVFSSLEKYTHLHKSNLTIGNGAIEIIYNFCFAFLTKNTPVFIPIPTFQEYETASKLNNARISFFKTMDLSKDVDSFISKIPKNGCIFLCNPNNPTGSLLSENQVLQIIKQAKKLSTLVFVDECFIELVPNSNQSVLSYVQKYDNLLVLRSLTKSFGLAGIRIGYAAASKKIINVLEKIKIPWSVNSLAQKAASQALKDKSHIEKSNKIIKKESLYLKNKISKLNKFDIHESFSNFILIKTSYDSTRLQKKLLKDNILIRDCKNFRGLNKHYFRIAIKSHNDNLKLIKAMEKIK